MKSLAETVTYENEDLLTKFSEFYDFPPVTRSFIFSELKKWLWIKALHAHAMQNEPDNENLQFHFHVLPSLRIVDEMWHIFILFTAEYRQFCQDFFGRFVDHTPSLPHRRLTKERLSIELERQFHFIGMHLGVETLQLWFKELGTLYPEHLINAKYVYRGDFSDKSL